MTHTVEITLQPQKQGTVGQTVQRLFRLEFDDRPENPDDEEEFRDTVIPVSYTHLTLPTTPYV